MSENCYTEYFLGVLGQIKLFHWSVMKYSVHVALDKLHSELSDKIDKFIEIYIGKFNRQPLNNFEINMTATSDCNNIFSYLDIQRDNLKKIRTSLNKTSELQNIIDEMLGEIDQCIYLIRLE
jgi:hypothetical protein